MNPSNDAPDQGLHLPSNRGEMVTVMVHYYRGEMGRMAGWRDRIDRTSNWAITVVAAMLSLSLTTPTAHHGLILFAMLLILLLLMIEARRYRFFDVYRGRVRLMERHYFARAIGGGAEDNGSWTARLAADLRSAPFPHQPAGCHEKASPPQLRLDVSDPSSRLVSENLLAAAATRRGACRMARAAGQHADKRCRRTGAGLGRSGSCCSALHLPWLDGL